ncbi:PQQ-binding-like beta-propeller repeat protein [Paenibacillus sp. NEAU-GSW1]|uniref:outer membrane protein assembly factor BamB family protein n=1 Tax=Paenibacillus sp. NEAU-GSW1 TaxID=2682486 RepID=UPI0012E14E88|nr:PQQ-binding-like beta-propeller repeat protein [Paenibacillus sp. NEAU-GSW1]MUT68509.1 PQQ-binding-like beta-propeller repeat protein [Paenibacillus sp. NEAU-GSW1]
MNRATKTLVIVLSLMLLSQQLVMAGSLFSYEWNRKPAAAKAFPLKYTETEGILTFRGSNERSAPSFGTTSMTTFKPKIAWSKQTRSSSWGGGAGWTGQPAIVKWSPEVLKAMNVKPKFQSKANFTEVIYASLDGYVYFLDLGTGEETRSPIKIGNPIKGSVSVDARGYPLLYVGEGIPENGTIGFSLYSLIDQKRLFRANGIDSFAYRKWGAFDSSALFNRQDDTLTVGGENGLMYKIKLNTAFEPAKKKLTIKPEVSKYRYKIKGNSYQGIENSIAAYGDLAFFADNGGSLQAINVKTHEPKWNLAPLDDTDATIVIEAENDVPFLYTGTEVDKQGTEGYAYIRKINGHTGKVVWQQKYASFSQLGDHPVNGGLLATPVLGKKSISNYVIFTIARYGSFSGGLMVALDKKTGKEAWRMTMKNYAWSSPVDVYDADGKAYIIQADSAGVVSVIDASKGKKLGSLNIGTNIESTPSVFNNTAVVASRGGKIYGIALK